MGRLKNISLVWQKGKSGGALAYSHGPCNKDNYLYPHMLAYVYSSVARCGRRHITWCLPAKRIWQLRLVGHNTLLYSFVPGLLG